MHNRFLKIFHFIDDFNKDHIMSLNKKIIIIYRNYKEKYDEQKILKIRNFCKSSNRKFFLANNIKLTLKLNLDGAYIPSFNRSLSVSRLKNRNITLKKYGPGRLIGWPSLLRGVGSDYSLCSEAAKVVLFDSQKFLNFCSSNHKFSDFFKLI